MVPLNVRHLAYLDSIQPVICKATVQEFLFLRSDSHWPSPRPIGLYSEPQISAFLIWAHPKCRFTPNTGRLFLTNKVPQLCLVQVFGCLHDGAVHTRQQQASEKRRGTKSRGARQDGGSNLTAGYGDLKGAPVAASARHIGASGCFGRPWSRNGRATTARKPPAGVHGGDLELLGSLLWRAPAWPVRAQRQSRPVLRLGNGDDGVMTCRSKLAPRRAAGIWAWRRERRPR